jgi:hypothetical protein
MGSLLALFPSPEIGYYCLMEKSTKNKTLRIKHPCYPRLRGEVMLLKTVDII